MVKYLETRGKGSSLSFARTHFSYKDPGNLTAKRAALKRRI